MNKQKKLKHACQHLSKMICLGMCLSALSVSTGWAKDDPGAQQAYPLVDTFRIDLNRDEIRNGESRYLRSVATQAYLYQFPAFLHLRQLSEFIQGRRYMAPKETPLGGWVLVRDLSTPKTQNVMPNVDTLYGASYVWLSKQGPVVLSVPAIRNRYYSVALCDSWFNNFEIIGTRTTGSESGNYLIVPPGWKGKKPAGIRKIVQAPTEVINLYQRIYLRQNEEIALVRNLQDKISLTPLSKWKHKDSGFAKIDDAVFRIPNLRQTSDPLKFFELTNAYTAVSHPPPSDTSLINLFKTAGIGPGEKLPETAYKVEAIRGGAADAQAAINASISDGPFRNGWRVPSRDTGSKNANVLDRAVAQMVQIGSLPSNEAMYFTGFRDGNNQLLDGRKSYRLTFAKGQLPPVQPNGFWSLTMYNEHSFLVENPIKRYIIRPDTEGLTTNPDGSLTIALQADEPQDVPKGNWLPAPNSSFIIALRAYLPQQTMIKGKWFPPAILKKE